jgi:hypothetical protein
MDVADSSFLLPVMRPCFCCASMSESDRFHGLDPLVAVSKLHAGSSKPAFVSPATATELEKWIALAGLGGQLKGY